MAKVCWVSFDRTTGETRNRGCGAGGDLEWFGGQLMNWLNPPAANERSLHLLAGSAICFVAPLDPSQEICMCKEAGCNKDKISARSSLNIPETAETVQCGGENCPLMDLSKIIGSEWESFNAACYQKPGDSEEHCFSTEGIYDENAVLSARLSAGLGRESSSAWSDYVPKSPLTTSQGEAMDAAVSQTEKQQGSLWFCL